MNWQLIKAMSECALDNLPYTIGIGIAGWIITGNRWFTLFPVAFWLFMVAMGVFGVVA